MSCHHPAVTLTENWLNPNRWENGTRIFYNRDLLASYGVDWLDLWCDGYSCSDCQEMIAAEAYEWQEPW